MSELVWGSGQAINTKAGEGASSLDKGQLRNPATAVNDIFINTLEYIYLLEMVTVTSARNTGRPRRRPNARAIPAATELPGFLA